MNIGVFESTNPIWKMALFGGL